MELLGMDTVDAVLIATPNYHHIEVLRHAIPAGKSILCEKPMCISVKQCAEVKTTRRCMIGIARSCKVIDSHSPTVDRSKLS